MTDGKNIQSFLDDMLQVKKTNERNEMIKGKPVFLLDVSGSMNERIGDKSKIDCLKNIMTNYPDNRKVSFSTTVQEGMIPQAEGKTNMSLGFKHLQSSINISIVLVSDGEPDSPGDALTEAVKLRVPVNVIYIGERGDKGDGFMRGLAKITGGTYNRVDPNKSKFQERLFEKIKTTVALLESGDVK